MTITAEEASTEFMALLDRAAEGEQITVTRQGIPIVNIVPVAEKKRSIEETLRRIEEFSERQTGRTPHIRELIEEGRKH